MWKFSFISSESRQDDTIDRGTKLESETRPTIVTFAVRRRPRHRALWLHKDRHYAYIQFIGALKQFALSRFINFHVFIPYDNASRCKKNTDEK